jgi:asparagine synthase (glutamine-hydrolysing)
MCGITGWVDYQRDLATERDTIAAMTATMTCRGPDAGGIWCSRHAAIGHRRLSVIDIEGGVQPMHAASEPGAVLTFSGEIYNFRELRRELAGYGHAFRTRSDTEVLLRAWLQWGAGCVSRLNGMFAFAVWDAASQELVLVRDRLGVKPLYYSRLGGGVVFGSEPKAILAHPQVRAELDAEGIAELFAQFGARTPGHGVYRGLAEVRPGWLVRFTRAGLHAAPYWQLAARPHTDDLHITVATVRDLLEDIVDRQLFADVPLCALLSGGLDSAALTAMAAGALRRHGGGPLATFSVDFAGSQADFRPGPLRPSRDEPYARRVAEHVGSRHVTILLDPASLAESQWEPLIAHDLPALGEMYVSACLLFRAVREQYTVALSGESADEVFGGYRWYHDEAMLAARTYPWAAGGSWSGLLRPEVAARVRLDEYAADRYADARAEAPRLDGEDPGDARIREVLYLGLTRWLPPLLDRQDRLSMAAGLKVRMPFCDHRLVEYVWNVPWPVKETGGSEKGLLRKAVADLLPASVLSHARSAYPASGGPSYAGAIAAQLDALLQQPEAPLFAIVDQARLAAAAEADPALPGAMAMRPDPMAAPAFLLDVNEWLRRYHVRLVLARRPDQPSGRDNVPLRICPGVAARAG